MLAKYISAKTTVKFKRPLCYDLTFVDFTVKAGFSVSPLLKILCA